MSYYENLLRAHGVDPKEIERDVRIDEYRRIENQEHYMDKRPVKLEELHE